MRMMMSTSPTLLEFQFKFSLSFLPFPEPWSFFSSSLYSVVLFGILVNGILFSDSPTLNGPLKLIWVTPGKSNPQMSEFKNFSFIFNFPSQIFIVFQWTMWGLKFKCTESLESWVKTCHHLMKPFSQNKFLQNAKQSVTGGYLYAKLR